MASEENFGRKRVERYLILCILFVVTISVRCECPGKQLLFFNLSFAVCISVRKAFLLLLTVKRKKFNLGMALEYLGCEELE